MKIILLVCVTFSFLAACWHENGVAREPVQSQVRKLIQNSCTSNNTCEITLSRATKFEWDKFYFFDMNVEDAIISKVLGFEYKSLTPNYSRKWIFLKNNELVLAEEDQIPEVDRPMEVGDIDFDLSDQRGNYAAFTNKSNFEAVGIAIDNGTFYRLRCINCK